MRIYAILFLAHVYFIAFGQSTDKIEMQICDSTLIEVLRTHIDEIIADSIYYDYDSSGWEIHDNGEKYFVLPEIRSSIGVDSFLRYMDRSDLQCSFKSYAYIFDYLLYKGLDFEYDYNHEGWRVENRHVIYRVEEKEYKDKDKTMQFFFKVYGRYDNHIFNLRKDEREKLIQSIVNFGDLRYPLKTMNILKLKPPLNKWTYNLKDSKVNSK